MYENCFCAHTRPIFTEHSCPMLLFSAKIPQTCSSVLSNSFKSVQSLLSCLVAVVCLAKVNLSCFDQSVITLLRRALVTPPSSLSNFLLSIGVFPFTLASQVIANIVFLVTVNSLWMDTSLKRTPLKSGHVELVPAVLQPFTSSPSKTDTSLRRTVRARPERVCLRGRSMTACNTCMQIAFVLGTNSHWTLC